MKNILLKLLNHIKMGNYNKKPYIIVPNTFICIKILNILYKEGFINYYENLSTNQLKVHFKYLEERAAIQYIKGISKPSLMISYKYKDLFDNSPLFPNLNIVHNDTKNKNIKKIINILNINYLYHIYFIKTLFNNYKLKNDPRIFYTIKAPSREKKKNLLKSRKNILTIKNNNIKKNNIKLKYKKMISEPIKNLKKPKFIREIIDMNYKNPTLKHYSHINHLNGLLLLSTNKGVMTHKEAYKHKLGGVCLCEIY